MASSLEEIGKEKGFEKVFVCLPPGLDEPTMQGRFRI